MSGICSKILSNYGKIPRYRKNLGSLISIFYLIYTYKYNEFNLNNMDKAPKKLLEQVRDTLRLKHYSIRTENSYISWIKRYILFHNKRQPKDMRKHEIEVFLTHLAVDLKVASSTQNQAFNALLFLYREVLNHRRRSCRTCINFQLKFTT